MKDIINKAFYISDILDVDLDVYIEYIDEEGLYSVKSPCKMHICASTTESIDVNSNFMKISDSLDSKFGIISSIIFYSQICPGQISVHCNLDNDVISAIKEDFTKSKKMYVIDGILHAPGTYNYDNVLNAPLSMGIFSINVSKCDYACMHTFENYSLIYNYSNKGYRNYSVILNEICDAYREDLS